VNDIATRFAIIHWIIYLFTVLDTFLEYRGTLLKFDHGCSIVNVPCFTIRVSLEELFYGELKSLMRCTTHDQQKASMPRKSHVGRSLSTILVARISNCLFIRVHFTSE